MTLWQILIVVAVAWFSGALFGIGWSDLRARVVARPRAAARFSALEAALESSVLAPAGEQRDSIAPAEPESRAQRPHFWFVDTDVSDANTTAATERAPPGPAPADAEQAPAEPSEAAAGGEDAAIGTPPEDPQVAAPVAGAEDSATTAAAEEAKPAMAETVGAANGQRVIPAARAPENAPAAASSGRSKTHRNGHDKGAKQIARWRALDRRAQSRSLMFWVEIALLILILIGVSWGMVYFVTQPLADGLQ